MNQQRLIEKITGRCIPPRQFLQSSINCDLSVWTLDNMTMSGFRPNRTEFGDQSGTGVSCSMTEATGGTPEIEPLDPDAWFEHVEKLFDKCAKEPPGSDIGAALRRAYHLAQLAPAALRPFVAPALGEARFEQLLECEAFDDAALGLLNPATGLRLTRSPRSKHVEVTAWFDEALDNARPATGPSAASAILQSWLDCLSSLWKPAADKTSPKDRQAPRLTLHKFRT